MTETTATVETDRFRRPFGCETVADALKRLAPRDRLPVVRVAEDGRRTLRAVRPNAGIATAYRKKMEALVDEMGRSVLYWLKAAYRRNEPAVAALMAEDSPADELRDVVRRLRRRWIRRFDRAAKDLAAHFAKAAVDRSDTELRNLLKRAGLTVEFELSAAARDVLKAAVAENVALIRSIPSQYMDGVEGAVMRSVSAGRDLGSLARELRERHGVTRRRAALIARDQNAKATAAIQCVRFVELGIEKAVWRHSHAGKEPRPTHVKNDGQEFEVRRGWFDPDPKVREYILPGQLINCRCFATPVLPRVMT
jgi:SPP1 gp7 family putative phage head morphogenesis protein